MAPRPMRRKRGDDYFGGGISSNMINTTVDHKISDDDPTPETPIPSRLPKRRVISTSRVRLSPSCQSSPLDRDETRSYKCDKCGMSFARPQQLGGHKTVHRAKRRSPAVKSASSSRLIYEGSICYETFGSDQAQGEHQRMHSDPNDHVQVQAHVQPSSSSVNAGDGDVYQAPYGNMERRESRRRRPRKQIRPSKALT